jgi:SRSO17 transposase
MDLVPDRGVCEARFNAYLDALSAALGHADRATPFQSYCTGLLLPGERRDDIGCRDGAEGMSHWIPRRLVASSSSSSSCPLPTCS